MNFTSPVFICFYVSFLILIIFKQKWNLIHSKYIIIVASMVFYGYGGVLYLLVLLSTCIIDFNIARLITKNFSNKKYTTYLMWTSIFYNLSILIFFKYISFLSLILNDTFSINYQMPEWYGKILIPLGISFFTFQSISYVVDVKNGRYHNNIDLIDYLAFLSFFPQLIAGPISRAENLLPKLTANVLVSRNNWIDGIEAIILGFLLKTVFADNLGIYVDLAYSTSSELSAPQALFASVCFTFQIYCDFFGYCLVGIGAARMIGIELATNFKKPYLSTSVGEFWRRWHITLGSWFKDYIFKPLAHQFELKRGSYWGHGLLIMIVFLFSGLWHGASYTFLIWGVANAIIIIGERGIGSVFPIKCIYLKVLKTFLFINFLWIFFRADNVSQAFDFYYAFFGKWTLEDLSLGLGQRYLFAMALIILLLFTYEALISIKFQSVFYHYYYKYRSIFLSLCVFIILNFANWNGEPFIYFRF